MSDLHDAVKFHMDAFFKAGMKAGWEHANNFGSIGHKLARLGRVTDAEFEVIEPNNEQDDRPEQSAGTGNNYINEPNADVHNWIPFGGRPNITGGEWGT